MKKKIIVVDDDPDIIKLLQSRLEANGYEIKTAANGLEGYSRTMSFKPDLIILDISMPVLDGYSFVKEMRTDPDCKDIPVLVISAKHEMKEVLAEAGYGDFIAKPFKTQEILDKIQQILSK